MTKTATPISIIEACEDEALFKNWFKDRATWRAWFSFLKTVFALPLDQDELEIFRQCTGRDEPPIDEVTEAWLCCGRRAGKSLMLALCAAHLAALCDWSRYLSPGERGTVMIVAADRRQARTIFRYLKSLFRQTILAELIERETADALDLSNGITIEILTASFRTVRGYSLVACLADEISFWRNDETGANPDKEILAAIRPAMATVPGSRLLVASSPYSRKGELWNAYRRHYGKPSPVLLWKAPTLTMNPTVPRHIIDEAYQDDPASAAAEYGAEFRSDVETFVTREAIDQCTVGGRLELPPAGQRYVAFVDPSGGSSDSMTLGIAHHDEWTKKTILDCIREIKAPFSPANTVNEFAALLRSYGVTRVVGDHYAGEWPREQFRLHGIGYETSSRSKSELALAFLPMMNSATCELLDAPRLQQQLLSWERKTSRAGRDSIDHGPGGHDDIANAVSGALVLAAEGGGGASHGWISVPSRFTHPQSDDEWRRISDYICVKPPTGITG
jgi:hypothetical protein